MKKSLIFLLVLFTGVYSYSQSQSSGYLPKFGTKLSLENSILFEDANSHIGIGTKTPVARLEIISPKGEVPMVRFSNSDTKSTIDIKGSSSSSSIVSVESGHSLMFETHSASGDANTNQLILHDNGAVNIGGTWFSAATREMIEEDTIAKFPERSSKSRILLYHVNSSIAGIMNAKKGNALMLTTTKSGGGVNANQLYLKADGNIGVGTASPSAKFEIYNGTLKLSGTSVSTDAGAKLVIDMGNNYNNFIKLENSGGVQFKVNGSGVVYAKEVNIVANIPFPDYVFSKEYKLMPLGELENFILANKHLPNVPSAKEVEETGINMGSLSNILLEKVEELTLYTIQQQKLIEELSGILEAQNKRIEELENNGQK
ncbi:MAG: hypothetical protein LBQ22_09185 [Bacteroidales bacterium]|jgi:hypothetical protein|nr:hypothetical protein [Bacteroidales bacterium]